MWRCIIFIFIINIICGFSESDTWAGRFFPFSPGEENHNELESEETFKSMMSVNHSCDDGKTNLTVDWSGSSWDYTCFMPRIFYRPNTSLHPLYKCEHIPKTYIAQHYCMDRPINYEWTTPTFGPHRSVWAKYGEYKYLPKQRWLHNLEHGAVAMLYHPCANSVEVEKLKKIVKNCLWRHVITPDRTLSEKRPLVLVTWGCSIEMSYVYEPLVKKFIKKHALHGAERISRDGFYDEGLIEPAKLVSNNNDSTLCPDIMSMIQK